MKDPIWQARVDHTRREAMKTLDSIRAGNVDEEQLDKLQNFVQFALALMAMEGDKKWARAKVNAEIMSLNREGK
jgi:hypothetical protein